MKKCSRCRETKTVDQFYVRSARPSGKTSMCKNCYTIARRDYYGRNKKIVLETNARSRRKNIKKVNAAVMKWQSKNREKVLEYKRKNNVNRRKSPCGKMRDSFSSGLRRIFKGRKAFKMFDVLPYTQDEIKEHLLKTIPPGCTVDDFMNGKLHIDHIIPVSAFNITDEHCVDFQRCWALSNLRFLPAKENLIKWNKVDKPFQPALL